MTTAAVKKIEAALGLARCSETNITGYCVEQTGNRFRIYDDYHSETFDDLPAALAYSAELAAEASADLTTIEVHQEDGRLIARCDGHPHLCCEIPWPRQITAASDSQSIVAAVTSRLELTQDQIAAVDHDGEFIFVHIH
jgi:hypothetical protein